MTRGKAPTGSKDVKPAAARPRRPKRPGAHMPAARAGDAKKSAGVGKKSRSREDKLRAQGKFLSAALAALKNESRRYRNLFEVAPEAYLVTNRSGIIREANAAAERLLQTPQGFLVGKPLATFIGRDQIRAFISQLSRAAQGLEVQTWEGKLRPLRGNELECQIKAASLRKRRGQIVEVHWFLNDISNNKRSQEEIRLLNAELEKLVQKRTAELDVSNRLRSDLALRLTSEGETLQSVMDNTLAQLAYLDIDFNFVLVNEAYAKGSGHSKQDLIGRNLLDLFPSEENRVALEAARDRGERTQVLAKPIIFSDQPRRGVTYWNWTSVPVNDASGRLQGIVLSLLDVSETVRAQHAEREHARKTAAILESITDSYITLDRNWRFTEINPAAERTILRKRKQELLGREIWKEYPQSVGGELWRECMIAAAEQHPVHFEAELSLDGKWHEVHAYPSREGLSIYLRDIEARKREQEANARLAAIVESSDDAIFSFDTKGLILSWNPGAEHLFGYSDDEIIGRPLSTLYPADHQDEFPQIMGRLLRGERIDHYETQRIRKDGHRLDVSLSISPIRDPAGKITGAAKIARDVSAQKRAREAEHFLSEASAVLASSLDYEATLQSVAHLALPFLADYCVIDVVQQDGSAQRVTVAAALPEREQALRDLMERYPPGSEAMGAQVIQSALPRTMWEMPEILPQQVENDPELMQMLAVLNPKSFMILPMIARGRTVGIISLGLAGSSRLYDETALAVAEDLARRAAIAVDNARLYEESQAALSARDQFLSSASHEVRTPLTVIQGYTQLLLQDVQGAQAELGAGDGQEDGKLVRGLKNIEYSAGRLASLMNDLLDVTRLSTNGISLTREPMDLSELLFRVVESVRSQKELLRRSSTMELRLALPDGQVWGNWDRGRLEQVVTNLVDNAVKYSPADGIIRIRLAVEEADAQLGGRCAHLTVCDEGIGIPPQDLGKIFQPFTRATNAVQRNYPGLGIGLAVSRAIVSEHGGCIWVESEGLDRGTCFHVVLPLEGGVNG